jgi:hypothetical protein
MTIIEKLIDHISQAATYNRYDFSKPSVILWPDGEKLWEKVIPMLADAMPNLFVLDEDSIDSRRGPSPKIRYLISRIAAGTIPIVYLPGISRLAFRGYAGFPKNERHLFALQFQGQFWTQKNGRDWTPLAFFSSDEGGLGLDIARDNATLEAIAEQIETILRAKISELQGKTIEASDIHGLVARDPAAMILQWMCDPEKTFQSWPASQKKAFSSVCIKDYGFEPEKDGVVAAAEKLVEAEAAWETVWNRFSEAPQTYIGIKRALEQLEQPRDFFKNQNTRLPQYNRQQEDELRDALLDVGKKPQSIAADSLNALCLEHYPRAHEVWAKIGDSPLACAAEHLMEMVASIKIGMAGADWKGLCESYSEFGWKTDSAVWKALSKVKTSKDIEAIQTAIRAVYKPWLEDLAARTYSLSQSYPNASVANCASRIPEKSTVILFVDGLRYDVGMELSNNLRVSGFDPNITYELASLPTVTVTSKPAWNPIAKKLSGSAISASFEPLLASTGQTLRTPDFRKLLTESGWTWFEAAESGDPSGSGWTEIGTIDHYGHQFGAKLASYLDEELHSIVQRIQDLFAAGWKKIIVTTDHG